MMEEKSPLKRALDLTSNKIVSACAGAGKTFALSKRYCAIIDAFTEHNLHKPKCKWLGFRNVLVITFTNKAAAEMSRRIYSDLHTLLQGKEIPELTAQDISLGKHIRTAPEEYKNWLRSTFSQNCIMTIDAFCGTVLREHAFLLGIDPQFKTSDELLAQKLYRETLNEFLNQQSKALRQELKNILQFTDKQGIIKFFNYFNERKVFLEEWLEFIEKHSEADIYQYWLDHYVPEFDVDLLAQEVAKIASYHEHIKQGEENAIASLKEKLKLIPKNTEQERRQYFMGEVLPYFLTAKNEYYSAPHSIQSKKSFNHADIYKSFKDIGNTVLDELSRHIPEEVVLFFPSQEDIHSIGVFKDLITLYAEFEDTLWQTQKRMNYLTFNDVIIKTRKLLAANEAVRHAYAHQFRHILVDEFQDTNNLRWEIIKHIARKSDGKLREKGLFIVGDKKQSIYRFQQADVEVMNVAQNELEQVTPAALIAFNDNYRSSRRFIEHVINPLFRHIFDQSTYPFEASFENTIFPEGRDQAPFQTDCVCDISIIENDPNQQEHTAARHAAYMAQKYLEWAETESIKEDVVVGILLRNFIHIHEYLRAFRELDIPFQIIGERNLFNQQEAYDLFNFISVLINPHDDAALVGLLRSPFFCVEDTRIYRCKNRKAKESFFMYMSHEEAYNDIIHTIQQWRELSQKMSVHELLQRILTQAHRELGYISEVGGRQRLANLDKLTHLISRLELESTSLQELHDNLTYQIRYKSEVAQADLSEPAKVQIMTIHKAKGLEFPAVIIPELNNLKTQAEKGNIFHSRIDPNGRIEVGISIKEQLESKKSNFLEIIKKQDKIEQEAEDKRMFYVAVTRAKYRIALLAEYTGTYNKKSWWASFVAAPLGLPNTSEELRKDEFPVPQHYSLSCLSYSELNDRLVRESAHEEKLKHWDPPIIPKPTENFIRITPHDIMNSLAVLDTFENRSEEAISNTGLALGTIFHALMEKHWWKWNKHESQIEDFVTSNFPLISYEKIKPRLQKHIENFAVSELFIKLRNINPANIFHEHHVTGWMDNDEHFYEVNGIIDVMFMDESGWTIVDFKTDQTLQFHDRYTLQLQSYLWIIRQLYHIEAKAFIYYSAFNELREVSFFDDYWSVIFPDEVHPFKPSLLYETPITSDILLKIAGEPVTIVNLTTYHATQMLQSLAAMNKMSPFIEIITLNRLLTSSLLKKLTPAAERMLVYKAAESYNLSDGAIELLAQAFAEYFEQGKRFKSEHEEFNKIYMQFETLRRQYGYHYDSEILERVLEEKLSGKNIILNGFFKDTARDFALIKILCDHAKNFYFIDGFNNNSQSTTFDYSQKIWEKVVPDKNRKQSCTACHSVETEIEGIAEKILELHKRNVAFDDITLAISSIDIYVPIIRKVFDAYGIPHRIYAPSSIADHPMTAFITGILTLMLSPEHLTWQTLSAVLLHPLMPENENFYALDAFIRKQPITYFNDVTDLRGIVAYHEALHDINEYRSSLELSSDDDLIRLLYKIDEFLHTQNIDKRIKDNDELQSIYTQLKKIISTAIETYRIIGFPDRHDGILRELKRQFKEAEIARKRSGKGVDMISYLESYESRTKVLFVAGLSEDYFPVPQKRNPFTKSLPHYEWQKSSFLLNSWMHRESHTYLSYPCSNMTGDVLNPSTLMEGMKILQAPLPNSSNINTHRKYYLTFEDQVIDNPDLPVLKRHNDYLSDEIGPYKGQITPDSSDKVLLSASSMNDLIQCPMQYLFHDILKIDPFEYDEDADMRTALGNHIHKTLEEFGEKEGFTLLRQDFTAACLLLDKFIRQVLAHNVVHLETDLFLQRLYAPYIEGVAKCDDENLLVKLLKFDHENFPNFIPILFEQVFGKQTPGSWPIFEVRNNVVKLHFRGVIDKISQLADASAILATDYKTGSAPSVPDIVEYWDVQPLVYLLTLEAHYHDKNIIFAYESTKDIATSNSLLTITLNPEGFLIKRKSTRGSSEHSISRDEFLQLLLRYGEKVIMGNFSIRERERYGKPCNYCPYSMLCRKNSMTTTCKNINELLPISNEE